MNVQGLSFWQQNQNYWQHAHAQSRAQQANSALINVMANAMANLSRGLSSIANGTALKRTNSQLTAAIQSVLQSQSGGSAAASDASGSGGSTAGTPAAPAAAVGTVPLTTATTLQTLGILPGGTFTVAAGANITSYTSTGSDTVGNLISALNIDLPTNAQVIASINSRGRLIITSRNTSDTMVINGSGTDAAALGFGVGNTTFPPTKAIPGSSPASQAAARPQPAPPSHPAPYTLPALKSFATAASILNASGVSGNLVDMLS